MDTSPTRKILDRILGKKKITEDIELPSEGRRRDPRLPKKKKSTFENIKEGYKIFKNLGKESE